MAKTPSRGRKKALPAGPHRSTTKAVIRRPKAKPTLPKPPTARQIARERDEVGALKRLSSLRKTLGVQLLTDVARAAETLLNAFGRVPTDDDQILVVAVDRKTKSKRLAQSATKDVRGWYGTDADLVREAAEKNSQTEGRFAHAAIVAAAKSAIAGAVRAQKSQDLPAAERRGRKGVNEPKLIAAYNELVRLRKPITYYALATQAGLAGHYRQAKRFMENRGLVEGMGTDPLPENTADGHAPAAGSDAGLTGVPGSRNSAAAGPSES